MEHIGLNSNVFAGGKIFHIQTAGDRNGMMQSEVYEAGRVILVQKKKLDEAQVKDSTEAQFRDFLNTFHQEISWEIELLFFIRDKIRTVKHAISNNKMGLIFMHKGMLDEAVAEFEHAIEKSPNLVDAYNSLGIALIQKGDYARAIDILEKGCALEPNYADAHNNLGTAYSKSRRYEKAFAEYQTAVKINPNYTEVTFNIGIALLESILLDGENTNLPAPPSRKYTALEIFQRFSISRSEFSGYRFFAQRFEKLFRQISSDELAQAIATAKEIRDAIQKPNLDETVHGFYLKFLFGGAGKDEKVLNDYRTKLEHSVEENPNYADLHNSLGIVYLIQCRNLFIRAMGHFKKAYEINPSYKNAYKNFRLVQNDGREFLNLLRAILK
jgi:tetratricopeptide (TPR) repeat protein